MCVHFARFLHNLIWSPWSWRNWFLERQLHFIESKVGLGTLPPLDTFSSVAQVPISETKQHTEAPFADYYVFASKLKLAPRKTRVTVFQAR
jgi:hypothetical protein